MHNLITRTSETYFRNILNAYFPYLLLINCQIKVHIQIVDLKVSLRKILSVEVYKSLDDLWAANLLCDPALTAKQFIRNSFGFHLCLILIGFARKDTTEGVTKLTAPKNNLQFLHIV